MSASELRLAALLCSRVCHDLISPVSALNNGLEVMEEDDEDMKEHAMALIAMSGKQASAKLQFARLAYGASSTAGDVIDLSDVRRILADLFDGGKVSTEWVVEDAAFNRDTTKVLVNLVLIAADCIPRGGVLRISAGDEVAGETLLIEAIGDRAKLNEDVEQALTGEVSEEELNPRSIQPYLAGLIARSGSSRIQCGVSEDRVEFRLVSA